MCKCKYFFRIKNQIWKKLHAAGKKNKNAFYFLINEKIRYRAISIRPMERKGG